MPINIPYMGTKQWASSRLYEVIDELPEGIFFDAFSGMGAVAEAIGPKRQIWTNEILSFPYICNLALFKSRNKIRNLSKKLEAIEQISVKNSNLQKVGLKMN